jgi:hypothetical protein
VAGVAYTIGDHRLCVVKNFGPRVRGMNKMGIKEVAVLVIIAAVGYWLGSSGIIAKYIPSA